MLINALKQLTKKMQTTKNSDLKDEIIANREEIADLKKQLKEIDKDNQSYRIKLRSTDDKKEFSRLRVNNNHK